MYLVLAEPDIAKKGGPLRKMAGVIDRQILRLLTVAGLCGDRALFDDLVVRFDVCDRLRLFASDGTTGRGGRLSIALQRKAPQACWYCCRCGCISGGAATIAMVTHCSLRVDIYGVRRSGVHGCCW